MIGKYDHIIWDWNGTLFDDAWLCVEIMNGILKERNLPAISLESYRHNFCFPVKDYYKYLGFDFEKENFENLANNFINIYEKRRYECKLFLKVTKTLELFKELKIPQSILSAYCQDGLNSILLFFGIENYFDNVAGLDDVYATTKIEKGKALFEALNSAQSRTLLIGDTVHDYEVAKALEIDCILLTNGHNSIERLKKEPKNAMIFDSIEEMAKEFYEH